MVFILKSLSIVNIHSIESLLLDTTISPHHVLRLSQRARVLPHIFLLNLKSSKPFCKVSTTIILCSKLKLCNLA